MARKGIFFPLKDAALRDDVHALGNLVGEVIKEQCGQILFDAVEGDRQAAIGRRTGDPEAAVELVVRSQGRTPDTARELIRAFSAWFQMVNMAEKVHRVRRRRQYMNDSSTPQPGGWKRESCVSARAVSRCSRCSSCSARSASSRCSRHTRRNRRVARCCDNSSASRVC